MSDLFTNLPIQHAPRHIVVGSHALIQCSPCQGTGEHLIPPHTEATEDEMRCPECNGGGMIMRRVWDV